MPPTKLSSRRGAQGKRRLRELRLARVSEGREELVAAVERDLQSKVMPPTRKRMASSQDN